MSSSPSPSRADSPSGTDSPNDHECDRICTRLLENSRMLKLLGYTHHSSLQSLDIVAQVSIRGLLGGRMYLCKMLDACTERELSQARRTFDALSNLVKPPGGASSSQSATPRIPMRNDENTTKRQRTIHR